MYNPFHKTTKVFDGQISNLVKDGKHSITLTCGVIVTAIAIPFFKFLAVPKIKNFWEIKKVNKEVDIKKTAKIEIVNHEYAKKEEEHDNEFKRDLQRQKIKEEERDKELERAIALEKAKTEEILKRKGIAVSYQENDDDVNEIPVKPTKLNELASENKEITPLAGLMIPQDCGGVMIYGDKGCLKSYTILNIICQLNIGCPIKTLPDFDPYFKKASSIKPYVIYVDGENGEKEVARRTRRYIDDINMERFDLYCSSKFGNNNIGKLFNSIKNTIQNGVTGTTYLVACDNAHSLLRNANSDVEGKDLLNKFKELVSAATRVNSKVVFVMIHHTNKEGKPYGTSVLEALTSNKIRISNTEKNDIKKVTYENHRQCGSLYGNKEFYLDVVHYGPKDDDDIELVFHKGGYDGGDGPKKMEVVECSQSCKNESKWEKTPENDAKIKSICDELIEEAINLGKDPTKFISCRKVANKAGTSQTTINNSFQDIINYKKEEAKELTEQKQNIA